MVHQSHRVHLRKEALKFSAAHMTVFPDGSKEALHGHNYTTEVSIGIKDISLKGIISFSSFKKVIREICDDWDEKLLLAGECPFMEIKSQSPQEIEFFLCKKRYVLPADEVIILAVDNITAETLAAEFCRKLIGKLGAQGSSQLTGVEVRIEEAPGQGASSYWALQ